MTKKIVGFICLLVKIGNQSLQLYLRKNTLKNHNDNLHKQTVIKVRILSCRTQV